MLCCISQSLFFSRFLLIMASMALSNVISPLSSQEWRPPPFEKVYVTPYEIMSTPEGTFHITSSGTMEKIRDVRSDWYGTYILKFKQECPVCGRYYDDNTVKEGYDCPLSQTEVIPHLWCK
jgi:hypothetical protein